MKKWLVRFSISASLIGLFILQTAAHAQTVEEGRAAIKAAAEEKRSEFSGMSFAEFEEATFKEPFEGGKYIVDGDVAIADEKQLREFYERNVAAEPATAESDVAEFTIHLVGGLQAIWPSVQKRALTYCVSDQFGVRYDAVVADMHSAAAAWEAAADLDFIHVVAEDGNCDTANANVVFDVRPVQVFGRYLARAFFPNEGRHDRNVLIDESSFQLDSGGDLQLVGILRHELGHTIGARHEHTRPESGRCFEDDDWEPLTDYDPFSVMHYPHCNGLGDWTLTLTNSDQNGVACVYGAASGFTIDANVCTKPVATPQTVVTFSNEVVEEGDAKRYETLQVTPNTTFVATLSGTGADPGDPDLYVKFNGTPQVGLEYDCRPYLTGAEERCEMDVPASASIARVMVHGYTRGNYNLVIKYIERQ